MHKGILFTAPPGAGSRKDTIFKEIVSLHPANDFSSVLYLCPNTVVQSSARTQFFSYLKNIQKISAYIPFQSFTIKQLALHIYEITPPSPPLNLRGGRGELSVISDRIRTLILCGILKDGNIGYARLLSDLLYKIRHYLPDKDLSRIKEEVRQLIFEEKAADRAVRAIEVLQSYENELKDKNLVDQEYLLRDTVKIISQGSGVRGQGSNPPSPPLLKGGVIPLPLAPCPLPLNYTLVIDGFYDPTPLELRIMTGLADMAEGVFVLAEEGSELYAHFNSYPGMALKKPDGGIRRKGIGYCSYPSMEEEVEGIAKTVKKRILDGTKPWEITVTFPVLSKYLPMLMRVFKKHGIPLSIQEYNLASSRPMIVLHDMLACMEEDYPAKDFLSLLASPHLPAIPSEVKEWAITYSYRAGIVKGRESWLSIRDILVNSSRDGLPDHEKERLDNFRIEIKKIIDVIEDTKQEKDIISFIDAFESALEKLGFFDTPLTPLDRREHHPITNRFAELRQFAGIFKAVEPPGFYIKYLLQGLTGADEDINGVRVLPFELAAGLETKELFFGGLIEGEFPSRPGIDPILPEKVKQALGMPHLEYYLRRQKHYFQRLLNLPAGEPSFSCPSADGDNIFLPSSFLDWGSNLSPEQLNIFTEEDALVREGEIARIDMNEGIFLRGEMFADKEAVAVLRQRIAKISGGFLSVTDIDSYRKCPLRFYIERIIGLEIAEPPRFEVEAMLWGSLAHRTMEYLFKDGDFDLEEIDRRLFKSLARSLEQFPIGEFWAKVAGEIFQKLLPRLKEQENKMRLEGLRPYKVEEKIITEIDGLRLKGKIDRVDIRSQKSEVRSQNENQNKENGQQNTVILLDYKTGAIDSDSLQMPLYAVMWQKKFSETVEKTGYYSLKEGEVSWYPKRITMEEFVQDALDAANQIVNKIKKGEFPAAPFKDAECRYCYHSPVCNKEGSNSLNSSNRSNSSNGLSGLNSLSGLNGP